MKKSLLALLVLAPLLLLVTTSVAWGHPGHGHDHGSMGFWAGLLHPITGLDHLLAAMAVGAWASVLGGSARWQMPAAFLVAMLGGAAVVGGGSIGVMSAVTVIALGLLLGVAVDLSRAAALVLVALFGVIHGASHLAGGAGLSAQTLLYVGAMLVTTAALHGAGVAMAHRFFESTSRVAPRWAGGVVTVAGVLLVAHQLHLF